MNSGTFAVPFLDLKKIKAHTALINCLSPISAVKHKQPQSTRRKMQILENFGFHEGPTSPKLCN